MKYLKLSFFGVLISILLGVLITFRNFDNFFKIFIILLLSYFAFILCTVVLGFFTKGR